MDLREKRQLRREMRREARDYWEECDGCTSHEMKSHLEAEFEGIDPTVIGPIIKMIMEFIEGCQ